MKIIWTILFILMLNNTVYAISPINIDMIKEAQDYGQKHNYSPLYDFLQPWISYEEKAERLNEGAEHAYLYTSFLLIATDAREKSLNGQKISLEDSKRIFENYGNVLSFSVVLFGDNPYFGQKAKVVLKQNKKVIQNYEVVIPQEAEETFKRSDKAVFRLQCYFYFLEKKIACDKPMILSIVTDQKKVHNFYFATANVK
ncbi:hypothetical protein [Pelosinus sp. sgz500959]|uniref:hypothetical protein n=1 Tax=Pelosinus sp. sgz500959 TaxID=3242472 RepID=UPI00366E492D